MRHDVWFVTGTDTGVGKTVVTAWVTRRWQEVGYQVRAVKPLCSGGRGDARILARAQGNDVSLDGVNPWHFRAALTPLVAARREGRTITRQEVLAYLERERAELAGGRLLVEGAGGLLSPLGEDFDARTLIRELRARVLVVAMNRLGCLNQTLLTFEALGAMARLAKAVLIRPPRGGVAARTNLELLRERLGSGRVVELPWLEGGADAAIPRRVALQLDALGA